ncbi:oligoendopeptidase F [Deinococcus yavapaiensis]|uniref:Oligopeptidase F n=1 Tax=Deinococcus yavapaiensis KR-236 TaxID=694435 RepID=A0A318S6P4_9DEIO|nr:oligoendopeptidase F [Deinococcus yavapaiensis]PYE54563.1 oligopeptidase F [Deinococcus yavapaiensis KR-236]
MSQTVPHRSNVDPRLTWDLESIFATPEAWEAERASVQAAIPGLAAFAGHLADSARLLAYLREVEDLGARAYRVMVYASLQESSDGTVPEAAARVSQAQALLAGFGATTAFAEPELLALPEGTLEALAETPELSAYAYYFQQVRERAPHTRSVEIEALFGRLSAVFAGPYTAYSALMNVDLKFSPATGSDDATSDVTNGSIGALLGSSDRALRASAFASYADGFLAFKNTFASLLVSNVRQVALQAKERGYESTKDFVLRPQSLTPAALENVLSVFERNVGVWHRYWRARKAALGVDTLRPHDVFAPLGREKVEVSYDEAVEMVLSGMAPLGEEYVAPMRRGLLEERWVDVYPNVGKSSGAFSSGGPGTHPFILLNHSNDLPGMSVLAHELGHSMHTYFTQRSQPVTYAQYGMTVAETASNFNQAMVRAHLLAQRDEAAFVLAMLDEAFANFHRYFFVMPTLARLELRLHEAVERGEGVGAEQLNAWTLELFKEGYGGEVEFEPEDEARVGITWAQFPHLFAPFYVHQYASGIAAATALSRRVLSGQEGARDAYLSFLKAGGSLPQLDALRNAGVDLSTPAPIEEAFKGVEGLVEKLEGLVR